MNEETLTKDQLDCIAEISYGIWHVMEGKNTRSSARALCFVLAKLVYENGNDHETGKKQMIETLEFYLNELRNESDRQ